MIPIGRTILTGVGKVQDYPSCPSRTLLLLRHPLTAHASAASSSSPTKTASRSLHPVENETSAAAAATEPLLVPAESPSRSVTASPPYPDPLPFSVSLPQGRMNCSVGFPFGSVATNGPPAAESAVDFTPFASDFHARIQVPLDCSARIPPLKRGESFSYG
jgi:hypothetical protein